MTDELDRIRQRAAAVKALIGEALHEKLRRVVRDFFADKPPGTSISEHDLAAYRQRLRAVVEEHRRQLAAAEMP